MRFLSLFSGIEAASVAWLPLGWDCVGVCEIEKFPCRVLAHWYPRVPNLGDVTAPDFLSRAAALLPDVIVGGSPCQSFSVAGLRKSLDDARGNLALRYVQTVEAIDEARRSAGLGGVIVVYENVPGILSTRDNAFGCLLGAMVGSGAALVPPPRFGWTDAGVVAGPVRNAAWRILDAQFHGLAQRRKRVFVVASPVDGIDPAQVLLEPKSMRRDPPARRAKREEVAGTLGGGSGTRGWADDLDRAGAFVSVPELAFTLNAGGGGRIDGESETFIPTGGSFDVAHSLRGEGFDASEDGTGRGTPIVAFQCHGSNVGPMGVLRAGNGNESGGVPFVATPIPRVGVGGVLAFDTTQLTHPENRSNPQPGDPCHHLSARAHVPAIAFQHRATASQSMNPAEVVPTMGAANAEGLSTMNAGGVRRLIPIECERLQGFSTQIERVIITACSENQNGPVRVALQCLRSPSDALPAEDGVNTGFALSADTVLWNDKASRDAVVALSVRIGHEPKVVAIRSRGKFRWSASSADRSKWFLPLIRPDDFARCLARLAQGLAQGTQAGRAASLERRENFILPGAGSWLAEMCGHGSVDTANVAARARIEGTTFITSRHGQQHHSSVSKEAILLCSVLDAIALCIPGGTSPARSYSFIVDIETDYTNIPGAADGPRYRALGNAMAVPVIHWIGQRILAVRNSMARPAAEVA